MKKKQREDMLKNKGIEDDSKTGAATIIGKLAVKINKYKNNQED